MDRSLTVRLFFFRQSLWRDAFRLRSCSDNGPAAIRLLLQVDTALGLVLAGPAPGARVFALGHRACARPAADAGVTLIVQWVVGQVISADIIPDLLVRPAGQRVQFYQTISLVPFHQAGVPAGFRLVAADGGNPGVLRGKELAQRLDLTNLAAQVGVHRP